VQVPIPRAALALLLVSALIPCASGAQPEDAGAFQFTKEDLKVLEECGVIERQFERRALVYHEEALEEHLQAAAHSLPPISNTGNAQWRVGVLRDPAVSAFGLPNGTIYVTTGLLGVLENDDQLAGVLGHEIVHVMNHDGYEAMREYRKKMTKREVIMAAAAGSVAVAGLGGLVISEALMASINASPEEPLVVAAISGYDTDVERRADQGAVAMMIHAHRDPAQISKALERMREKFESEAIPTFYSTSDNIDERLAYLRQVAGQGAAPSAPAQDRDLQGMPPAVGGAAYFKVIQEAVRQDVRMNINSRRFRNAVFQANWLVTAHPDDAADLCLLAEAYRFLGPRSQKATPDERSASVRHKEEKQSQKLTGEEEDKFLASTVEGRAALESNRARTEELYKRAADKDRGGAKPHLGLGLLYEQQGHAEEARSEYRMYLELAPEAPDKLRVQRRLKSLDQPAGGK